MIIRSDTMDKFLKRKLTTVQDSSHTHEIGSDHSDKHTEDSNKQHRVDVNTLAWDPGL